MAYKRGVVCNMRTDKNNLRPDTYEMPIVIIRRGNRNEYMVGIRAMRVYREETKEIFTEINIEDLGNRELKQSQYSKLKPFIEEIVKSLKV